MGFTTDPRLGHGEDKEPGPQDETYLILSDEERAKGFVRPVRLSYKHVGAQGPKYPLRKPTQEEIDRHGAIDWWEDYPEANEWDIVGRFWTQARLDKANKGCGTVTSMALPLAETYAAEPGFYGSTYCAGCGRHINVDEFVWTADGTRVGS